MNHTSDIPGKGLARKADTKDQRPGDSAVDVVSLRQVRLTPTGREEAERIAEEALRRIRALDTAAGEGETEPVTLGLFLFRTPRPAPGSSDPDG